MSNRSRAKHFSAKKFYLSVFPPKPKREPKQQPQWPDTQLFKMAEEYRDQRR